MTSEKIVGQLRIHRQERYDAHGQTRGGWTVSLKDSGVSAWRAVPDRLFGRKVTRRALVQWAEAWQALPITEEFFERMAKGERYGSNANFRDCARAAIDAGRAL